MTQKSKSPAPAWEGDAGARRGDLAGQQIGQFPSTSPIRPQSLRALPRAHDPRAREDACGCWIPFEVAVRDAIVACARAADRGRRL